MLEDTFVADITGLPGLQEWTGRIPGLRIILRFEPLHPRYRQRATDREKKLGRRYQLIATNTAAGQVAWLDARHRSHVHVENDVKQAKALGLNPATGRSSSPGPSSSPSRRTCSPASATSPCPPAGRGWGCDRGRVWAYWPGPSVQEGHCEGPGLVWRLGPGPRTARGLTGGSHRELVMAARIMLMTAVTWAGVAPGSFQ